MRIRAIKAAFSPPVKAGQHRHRRARMDGAGIPTYTGALSSQPGIAMKLLALALIVCGLVLAPVYWIHARFYTGSDAALLTLEADAARPAQARTWRSAPFTLAPEMAPVGLILVAQGHFSPNMDESRPPRDAYSATLSHDGVAGQPITFSLGVKSVSDSNPAFREHLLLMNKVQAGEYAITVSQAAEPAIAIDRMQLQVRQHLKEPDPNVVMAGIGLVVLGILVLVML